MDMEPQGELAIRTLAMPPHTNHNGDIFGGWIVSQMDLAGAYIARRYASNTVVTAAIQGMDFISPVSVGDFVCCYVSVINLGRTSMHLQIEAWALGYTEKNRRKVTEGCFVYVALDKLGKPEPIVHQ